jgi:hypothetical protein
MSTDPSRQHDAGGTLDGSSIPLWQITEIGLESRADHANPYADVDIDPLGQEPWHTWFALQGGHRNSGLAPQARYRGYYEYQPTRPVLETEAMYELVDCGGVNNTDEARQSAWKALLCGSPGYTYGGAGVWFIKWDADDPGCAHYNRAIGSWHEGMNLPGAAQMTLRGLTLAPVRKF